MSGNYIENMGLYWNERFKGEDYIWGMKPSKTADYALSLFNNEEIKSILIPGSGYGRNTKLFSANEFQVTGIEVSESAYELSKEFDRDTKFYKGNVMESPFDEEIYDAIYCFNVLHLFRKKDRKEFINKCTGKVRDGGFLFFVVFSDQEDSYGKGREVEENTFESKAGRPVHYYTKEDLINEFSGFEILETAMIEDLENHGKVGEHVHRLRYVFVRK